MHYAKTKSGLKKIFDAAPDEVKYSFIHLPKLVDDFPLEVLLSYAFSSVEIAHNLAIYCGIVKIHKAESSLAKKAVDSHHITREGFRTLYKTIYGRKVDATVSKLIEDAESIRDKVMHGKSVTEDEKRMAISRVLQYAIELNELASSHGGIRPFGKQKGFKGRGQSLDKSTTRWILKGVGLTIS